MGSGAPAYASGPSPDSHVLLASSGGRDSLGALVCLKRWHAEGRFARLSVVHVDHGLHPDSPDWARQAREQAEALGVPVGVRRVEVARGRSGKGRGSLEAAARQARYAALDAALDAAREEWPDHPPVLVTAHHAEDQAETVLLALMRGSGGRGLAGMSPWRPRGLSFHWRPFLDWPRERLGALAAEAGPAWVDDPSNDDPGFARNFLRHRVLPELHRFWPDAVGRIDRSAARLADEQVLLGELAAEDAGQSLQQPTLDWPLLAHLSSHRQLNVLRQWLAAQGVLPPPASRLAEWLAQLRAAAADRQPCLDWPGGQLRRWGHRLYWLESIPAPVPDRRWPPGEDCLELEDVRLCRRPAGAGEPATLGHEASAGTPWRVRPVSNSDRIREAPAQPTRRLKNRFQEAGIPPWERAAAVGIEIGGRLAAVHVAGRWWVEADFRPSDPQSGWSLDLIRPGGRPG
ncbi:MAG: tRNA lysidine(34) synthetase TilS [Guyparkeria sp.]|uniref:tRNA lysidine(34) synthetase TilS n=1 Tax=Guyparkeria sp. TaxID=2035736 RepID=UPI003978590D